MKRFLLTCCVLGIVSTNAFGAINVGVESSESNAIELPAIEPPSMNSCEKIEKKEIEDAAKVNHYDNVPIFNTSDKKVNIMLKQPSASLGTQQ